MSTIAISILYFPIRIVSSEKALRRIVFMLAVFIVIPLLAFYLFQIGDWVRANYTAQNYSAQIEELAESNLAAKTSSTNRLSLSALEVKVAALDFVKAEEIKYIPIYANYLAAKNN